MDWYKKKQSSSKKIVFSLDETILHLAIVEGVKLIAIDQILIELINIGSLTTAVSLLAKKYNLVGLASTLVLSEQNYQLLMTDKLSIPESKMASALRWKIKGLLTLPVKDVALDVFFVPPHGTGEQRQKVFVVAVAKSFLQMCLDSFEKALVPLIKVDIALFSLRNLIVATCPVNQTQLLINLSENKCQLTVFYNHDVYLVRKLNLGVLNINEILEQSLIDKLQLELQRSIDYCLSELKLPEPNQILFSPSFLLQEPLLEYFKKNLSQKVSCLDINNIVSVNKELVVQKQKTNFVGIGNAIGNSVAIGNSAKDNN